MNRARLSLLVYAGIALVLRFSLGMYAPAAVLALVLLAALLVVCVLRGRRESDATNVAPVGNLELASLLVLSSALLWLNPNVAYAGLAKGSAVWMPALYWSVSAVLGISVLVWVQTLPKLEFPSWFWLLSIVLAVVSVTALRVVALRVSPRPFIDVFVINNRASDYLLHGKNPYGAEYPDIYKGRYEHRPAFFYWPAYLYWATPFRWALHDVRYGNIAAELLAAGLLARVGKRLGLASSTSCLLGLVWLVNPVSLFVLEQAWIDPILILGVAALALAIVARQWTATGALLAFVAGVKQYGVLVVLLMLVYLLIHERQHLLRVILTLSAGLALLFGPFLLLDAREFYKSTIKVYLDVGARDDALSVPTLLAQQFGRALPENLLRVIYLALVAGGCAWLARERNGERGLATWAGVMAATYMTVFLMGKLAFCNYYYFVEFLVLLFAVLLLAGARHSESEPGKAAAA